jgi:hypothetical protein
MRYQKAALAVSLLFASLMLAVQSAKADNIVFNDLTDSPTLSGSTRLTSISCSSVTETCTAFLPAPFFNINAAMITYRLGETSTTGNVSDALLAVVTPLGVLLTFSSDLPTALGEANGLGPCVVAVLFPGGCNAVENGSPQLAGSVTWRNPLTGATSTDNFFIQSDLGATVPEPASLILFGSGLVIAGGFLRRRRRLAIPSV